MSCVVGLPRSPARHVHCFLAVLFAPPLLPFRSREPAPSRFPHRWRRSCRGAGSLVVRWSACKGRARRACCSPCCPDHRRPGRRWSACRTSGCWRRRSSASTWIGWCWFPSRDPMCCRCSRSWWTVWTWWRSPCRPALGQAPARLRVITGRLRQRGAVLLSVGPWPGADLVLTSRWQGWAGLGQGHGRLRERELVVDVSGRGAAAGRTRQAALLLRSQRTAVQIGARFGPCRADTHGFDPGLLPAVAEVG